MKLNQQTRKIGLIISGLCVLSLTACEDSKEVVEVKTKVTAKGPTTGVLSDGFAISGVAYSTASGSSGVTDANGVFHYQHGDNVRFKLGELTLADIKGSAIVSPIDLAAGNENKLRNLLILLQSLDSDDDVTNGISISSKVANAIKSSINLEADPATFSDNAALKAAREAAELPGEAKSLEEAGEQFLARGINLLSSHIWVKYDNQSASALQIAEDGSGEYLHGEATADDSCDENRVCGGETIFRTGVESGTTKAEAFDTRGFKLVGTTSIDTNLRAGLSHPRATWRINTDGDELIISDIVVAQRERQQSSLFGELFHIAKPIELSADDEPIATEVKERRYSKMDNTAQGIVGAWSLDKDTVKSKLFLFFPNNRFMLIDPTGQTVQSEPLACGKPGIEFAAYSYDGASKALKITSFIFDTNACAGLSESADKLVTFDISSDGNTATLTKQGQAAVKLSRVSN